MFQRIKAILRVAEMTGASEERLAEMLTVYVALAGTPRPPPAMPRPFVRVRARLTTVTS
jgi:hypothetical protein